MSTISYINSIAIASISADNGIANANIAYVNGIEVSHGVIDSLTLNISTIEFDWDGTPQGIPVIGVTCNTSWTCTWDNGDDFVGDKSGATGNSTVTISCLGENYLPSNLVDTLRFYIGATEYAWADVTQYQEGI